MTRSASFDSVKGALIILVVAGHMWGRVPFWLTLPDAVWAFIYAFHMPAFVLLSGYFSKVEPEEVRWHKNFRKLLLPALVFQAAYYLFALETTPSGSHWRFDPSVFSGGLWFLVALFVWRTIALPALDKTRHPILIALALSITAGFIPSLDHRLALGRIFLWLPLFMVLRMKIRAEMLPVFLDWTKKRKNKVLLVGITVPIFALLSLSLIPSSWIATHRHLLTIWNCPAYDPSWPLWWLTGPLHRLTMLAVGLVLSMAFLVILRNGNAFLARIGRNTLMVLCLEGFAVYLLHFLPTPFIFEIASLTPGWPIVQTALCLATATGIAWALSRVPNPFKWKMKLPTEDDMRRCDRPLPTWYVGWKGQTP
ncbi:MAG: acyltransferase family protein [Patescibacteria group bacterium]